VVTKLIFSVLSDDLDIAHLKKSEHYESNVLEHHPVETKGSDGQWNVFKIYWQMILEEI